MVCYFRVRLEILFLYSNLNCHFKNFRELKLTRAIKFIFIKFVLFVLDLMSMDLITD